MQFFFRSLIFAMMGGASWVKVDNLLVTKKTNLWPFLVNLRTARGCFLARLYRNQGYQLLVVTSLLKSWKRICETFQSHRIAWLYLKH